MFGRMFSRGKVGGWLLCLGLFLRMAEGARSEWGKFVEEDFPFFSSVVDARTSAVGSLTNNLTPRGLVLNLGQRMWTCFDTDLLRVAAIWEGEGVTPISMSQGSYTRARQLIKAQEGQSKLPQPVGKMWLANGIYPGVQRGTKPSWSDPRPAGPDVREVGRGPLKEEEGRFKAVRFEEGGVVLDYALGGRRILERLTVSKTDEEATVERWLKIEAGEEPLVLVVGIAMDGRKVFHDGPGELERGPDGVWYLRVPAFKEATEIWIGLGGSGKPTLKTAKEAGRRWEEEVTTSATLATGTNAYVIDNIALPLENRWKRNVRLADVAFFQDGRAAAVTFDGDVWMISGLSGELKEIRWRRYASGFHEPLGMVSRDGDLFVFDRNGLWRLRDADGNGEADVHEMFCNSFTQTAETREFTCSLKLGPGGEFYIAKGGQQTTTVGKHNGAVLRISADGKRVTQVGRGFRMPFIGVHPTTGLVTASDQQGHYVPTTPLHWVREDLYYGFIPVFLPKEKYPAAIADPLTWIPHAINPSGVSQAWVMDGRFGPLAGRLIHLGYYRPEIFAVTLDSTEAPTQAAVMSLTRELAFPLLNGAMNPADGQLYVVGFQIWGTEAKQISGLARVRYSGAEFTLPKRVSPMKQGVLLEFEEELEAGSITAENFSAERWNYRRTPEYGSPHYRLDGSKGQERIAPSAVYLSKDRKSVFVAIPGMVPVMQMRLGWSVRSARGLSLLNNTYFTAKDLKEFDAEAAGFGEIEINLNAPAALAAEAETPVTIEEGRRLAELMGCVACHSADGSTLGKVGPTWKGLYGAERVLADKQRVIADEGYLRRSILEPSAQMIAGFDKLDTGMPSYEGVLTAAQVEAILVYIRSLGGK